MEGLAVALVGPDAAVEALAHAGGGRDGAEVDEGVGADDVEVELCDGLVGGARAGGRGEGDDVRAEIGRAEGPHEVVDVEG